jgi:GNAT superfamily N-acetyltransferase
VRVDKAKTESDFDWITDNVKANSDLFCTLLAHLKGSGETVAQACRSRWIHALVARPMDSDEIVGSLTYRTVSQNPGTDYWVNSFWVDESHRRMGVGSSMVERVFRHVSRPESGGKRKLRVEGCQATRKGLQRCCRAWSS